MEILQGNRAFTRLPWYVHSPSGAGRRHPPAWLRANGRAGAQCAIALQSAMKQTIIARSPDCPGMFILPQAPGAGIRRLGYARTVAHQ
jgi:hypothetical protein